MIYDSYFVENYDESDIDPTCCDEVGYLETMIWIEKEKRCLIESFIKSDMEELINKDLLNEGGQEWIYAKIEKIAEVIDTICKKIISIIVAFINKIKSFFSKKKDNVVDTNLPDDSSKQGNKQRSAPVKSIDIGKITYNDLTHIDYGKLPNITSFLKLQLSRWLTTIVDNTDSIVHDVYDLDIHLKAYEKELRSTRALIVKAYDSITTNVKPITIDKDRIKDNVVLSRRSEYDNLIEEFDKIVVDLRKQKVQINNKLRKYINDNKQDIMRNRKFIGVLSNETLGVFNDIMKLFGFVVTSMTTSINNEETAVVLYKEKINSMYNVY